MSKKAHITGDVVYREGDGINISIPVGPCEIDETVSDVTLSWRDGDTRGCAAMPMSDFKRYAAVKAIQVINPVHTA